MFPTKLYSKGRVIEITWTQIQAMIFKMPSNLGQPASSSAARRARRWAEGMSDINDLMDDLDTEMNIRYVYPQHNWPQGKSNQLSS